MRILVADDDDVSRLVVQAAVQSLGHDCVTASDGARAWQLTQDTRPDVVITDRAMPGLDGLDLCRRIREHQRDGYTYLVLLTSYGDPGDVLAGMRAGADDYLAKPLDPLDLEARLLAAKRVTDLHAELSRAQAELARQAGTDPLTGLRNRLSLRQDLDDLHQVSGRYGHGYCVALCDVDHFKRYNDTYGHLRGDAALQTVAAILTEVLRDADRVYRYGGEEFLVLFPQQTVDGAAAALERVRDELAARAVEHRAGGPGSVLTVSIGLSGSDGAERGQPSDLVAAADTALYAAKVAGRDRVRCWAVGHPAGCSPVADPSTEFSI